MFERLFKRRSIGEKEANMAEAGTTATPPAGSGGPQNFDADAFQKSLVSSVQTIVGTAVANAVKPLQDQVTALQAAATPATPAADKKDQPQFLTADAMKKILDEREQTSQQTAQQRQQRDQFISTRLKNLPPAYANQLGNDPAKWEDEAKTIAGQFTKDLGERGFKVPDVGGETALGSSPAAVAPDLTKMSTQQMAELGLSQSKPANGAPVTSADQPAK